MTDALAVDEEGNALVAFHRVAEDVVVDDAPLPLSLVAWWYDGLLLLVFNRRRRPAMPPSSWRSCSAS